MTQTAVLRVPTERPTPYGTLDRMPLSRNGAAEAADGCRKIAIRIRMTYSSA